MAEPREGTIVGDSCFTQSKLAAQTNSLIVGDDTDSDEPLLDISEVGFGETNIASDRTNDTGFQTQMEQEGCESEGPKETFKADLASSRDNIDLGESQHQQPQQHQQSNRSPQVSNKTNGTVFLSSNQTGQNQSDFLSHDFWQKSNLTIGSNKTATRPNDIELFDPLNFGDPTFVSSYISPSALAAPENKNPAFCIYPKNPLALRGSNSDHSATFHGHLNISSETASLHSSIPNIAATTTVANFLNINRSPVYAVRPVLQEVDRKSEIANKFITSSQPSQTLHAQSHPNKSVYSLGGFVEPTDITLANAIDKDDRCCKVPTLDLIIKDYTSTADRSRGIIEDVNTSRFAARTSSKDTSSKEEKLDRLGEREVGIGKKNVFSSRDIGISTYWYIDDKGATRGYIDDKDITHRDLGNKGMSQGYLEDKLVNLEVEGIIQGYFKDKSVTPVYLQDIPSNIRHSINSEIMGDEELVLADGCRGGRHLGSNSDKYVASEGSNINRARAELTDTFYKEGRENVLYAENMHSSRSHWEDANEDRLLEAAPLLETELSNAHRPGTSSNPTSGGAYFARHSPTNVYQVCNNKAGVTSRATDAVTVCHSGSDSIRNNPQEDFSNNTRGGVDNSRAMRNYPPPDDSRYIQRNAYGEFSPLPHLLENGRPGRSSERGTSYAHCHKKRMTSLTDRLALRQLISVVVLCLLFMIGEGVGGVLANSIALFTDVLHLGSDLISFIISLLAMWLANKPATRRMSFGYHRAEVLGAMFSVFIIWLVSGVLCYIAVDRIMHEHYKDVKPDEMLITASLGVVFNIIMGLVLHSEMCCGHAHSHSKFGHGHSHGVTGHGHSHSHSKDDLLDVASKDRRREASPIIRREGFDYQRLDDDGSYVTPDQQLNDVTSLMVPVSEESNSDEDHACSDEDSLHKHKNINVRAAFIHVVGDIIQSLGVLVAALIIKFTTDERYRMADPICTFLFSLLVLITTITVLRDALLVVMEGVPRDLSTESLRKELIALDGVVAVHSLHIWALTLDRNALSVHLAVENPLIHDQVLSDATKLIQNRHHFFHSTIQVELYDEIAMKSCKECMEWN